MISQYNIGDYLMIMTPIIGINLLNKDFKKMKFIWEFFIIKNIYMNDQNALDPWYVTSLKTNDDGLYC